MVILVENCKDNVKIRFWPTNWCEHYSFPHLLSLMPTMAAFGALALTIWTVAVVQTIGQWLQGDAVRFR